MKLEDFQWVPLHLFVQGNKEEVVKRVEKFLGAPVSKNFQDGEGMVEITRFFSKVFEMISPRLAFNSLGQQEQYMPVVYDVFSEAARANHTGLLLSSMDTARNMSDLPTDNMKTTANILSSAIAWVAAFYPGKIKSKEIAHKKGPTMTGVYAMAERMSKVLRLPRSDIFGPAYAYLAEANILSARATDQSQSLKGIRVRDIYFSKNGDKKDVFEGAAALAAYLRTYFPGSLANQELLLRKFIETGFMEDDTQILHFILGRFNRLNRAEVDENLSSDHEERLKNSKLYGLTVAELFLKEFAPAIALNRLFQYANVNKIPALIVDPHRQSGQGHDDDRAQLSNIVQKSLTGVSAAATGGIDLTLAQMNLQLKQYNNQPVQFHIDPAQLARLRNAPGFEPVIIRMVPLADLHAFLGVK